MQKHFSLLLLTLLIATPALATTFIVPTDEELLAKSAAVVIGTVEGKYVQDSVRGLETVYEIRVTRSLKGTTGVRELIRITSPGGELSDRGVLVHGAAHFEHGERVLLFLTRHHGQWTTTDLTLGKFRFASTMAGEKVLIRDEERIAGWDRAGREHVEKIRREGDFLRFIEERAAGRRAPATNSYFVESSETLMSSSDSATLQPQAPAFAARTYVDNVQLNGNWVGTRWPNVSAGVPFYKRTSQNISGAADGGVSVIQNALASWNNEPASSLNLTYAGQIERATANHDATNVVEFNDPQGKVAGSWGGSGTVGITFLSYNNPHPFANEQWWSISDADVVFQDGFPATNAAFATAMAHEIGHGLGFRHSNAHYTRPNGADIACDPSVEECSNTAIMYFRAISSLGYTLQTWDQNAAQAVYGSGTQQPPPPCTRPTITSQPQSQTVVRGNSATLTVGVSGPGPFTYQWYIGTSGNTASPYAQTTVPSITITPSATTSFWVRVSNSCGPADSATATITVTEPTQPPPPCPLPSINSHPQSQTITAGSYATFSVSASNASSYQWFQGVSGSGVPLSGSTQPSLTITSSDTTQFWVRVSNSCGSVNSATATLTVNQPPPTTPQKNRTRADFDFDGRAELILRNTTTNQLAMWDFTGRTVTNNAVFDTVSNTEWRIEGFGDFNADGRYDILFRHTTLHQVAIWLMEARTRGPNAVVGSLPSGAWQFETFGDYNGDGRTDAIARNPSTGQVAMWEFNGLGVVSNSIIYTVSDLNWRIQGSADFNGDGDDEIIWRNLTTNQLAMWEFSGRTLINGGVFQTVSNTEWRIQGVGDFNKDGRDDILWRHDSGGLAIWFMNYRTRISGPVVGSIAPSLRVDAIGDYDGDGDEEVVMYDTNNHYISLWEFSTTAVIAAGDVGYSGGPAWRVQPPFLPVR